MCHNHSTVSASVFTASFYGIPSYVVAFQTKQEI